MGIFFQPKMLNMNSFLCFQEHVMANARGMISGLEILNLNGSLYEWRPLFFAETNGRFMKIKRAIELDDSRPDIWYY